MDGALVYQISDVRKFLKLNCKIVIYYQHCQIFHHNLAKERL